MSDIVELLRADAASGEVLSWERLREIEIKAADELEKLGAEIERLHLENEKLAAAMSSDGADACGALVVAEAEIERLHAQIADQQKDIACDEQRVADLMGDVQRQGLEIKRLRERLEVSPDHNIDGIEARDATIRLQDQEIERLRGQIDAWSRSATAAGREQNRLRAEIERLRGLLSASARR